MGKLIYSMLTSLDGYTEDEDGRFGWGAPEDEEVHSYINALVASLGTYLYGRRMYQTMVARTRVEREFDPDAVRRLKTDAKHDISVDGPELAAQAGLPRSCWPNNGLQLKPGR